MSNIGFVNFATASLASSISGSQQARPEQNTQRTESARQDFKVTLEALSAKTTGDVGDTTLEADRDADGRSLLHSGEHEDHSELTSETAALPHESHRVADVDAAVGRLLDLDA
ncbi:MAG: hypothetical protein R3C12_08025 [Planctomycetaceae bacterium]|nr:hypothetical protein [Planctomycetaceae bacterium]